MKLPKYVQAWVDDRDGRVYYYLRRRGYPRVRLPGLPWSPSFMAAYESALAAPRTAIGAAHQAIGTKARLALVLLLDTGQRRSDVVKMGRQPIRDGVLTVKQQKTGKPLAIPVHPNLQVVLDATASEHLTFLVTATGKPYGGNHFSETFREWCDAAGLPKRCK